VTGAALAVFLVLAAGCAGPLVLLACEVGRQRLPVARPIRQAQRRTRALARCEVRP
jgi:hypothetical protein